MRDCRNCKFAEWQYTKHVPPLINPRKPGKCRFRVVFTVPAVLDANEVERALNGVYSRTIWADSAHENCPTWERKPDTSGSEAV